MKAIIITSLIIIASLFGGYTAASPASDDYVALQGGSQTVLDATNDYRHSLSLPTLIASQRLTNAAQAKANDLCTNNYWSHDRPDGTKWSIFVEQSGFNYEVAGENLAKGHATSAVTDAWIASPAHNDNLITDWTHVGIAQSECSGKNFTVAEYAR